ncbi:hypothetical protein HMPREF3291_05335 [Bacillus sp. HMSC76G11]|nr:hypothetical protein HMPREF3291_05335 [Bacillus sp. HMSC76G11]
MLSRIWVKTKELLKPEDSLDPKYYKMCTDCEGSGLDEVGHCQKCKGAGGVKKTYREIHNLPE